MNRHAFLIMAHNNWYTLEKLLQIIDAPWNDVYLHIDRKSTDFSKEYIKKIPKHSSIKITKRHNVTWGNESQIKAEMTLFKTAFKNGPYHYYHLISGQDLPLLNAKEFYEYFDKQSCNFLHTVADVTPFEFRLKRYTNVFRNKWIPKTVRNKLNAISEILQSKTHINRLIWLKSKYPKFGKGHNWCDLTHRAVEKLIEAEKDIKKFTRFTLCSDEMYKQIILLNQSEKFIGVISENDIRYIDWSEQGKHPRTFTMQDLNALLSNHHNCVFARKFDENIDREVIEQIYLNLCLE